MSLSFCNNTKTPGKLLPGTVLPIRVRSGVIQRVHLALQVDEPLAPQRAKQAPPSDQTGRLTLAARLRFTTHSKTSAPSAWPQTDYCYPPLNVL